MTEQLTAFEDYFKTEIHNLHVKINSFISFADKKFEEIPKKVEEVPKELEEVKLQSYEQRISDLEEMVDCLQTKLIEVYDVKYVIDKLEFLPDFNGKIKEFEKNIKYFDNDLSTLRQRLFKIERRKDERPVTKMVQIPESIKSCVIHMNNK